ncbi:hypothetical protein QBC40DRAFT_314358 [Triangularia verruculosa]|uniref:Uncharacterized protein n=1 Tax=Triangularia verruculosa TaxID=2587418 RepID=A0AAN6XNA1_9PEZI|nr:hypothetical protein QBC40DRAFT_314358 [Triangularia verruculosa]
MSQLRKAWNGVARHDYIPLFPLSSDMCRRPADSFLNKNHAGSGSASQSDAPSTLNPLMSATGLVVILLISAISVGVAIALLLLYLRKRKRSAQRRLTARLSGMPEIRAGDSTETERSHIASTTSGGDRNRLQKFGGSKEGFAVVEISALSLASMAIDDAEDRGEQKRHRSLPVLWGRQREKAMLRRLTEEDDDQLLQGGDQATKGKGEGKGLGRSQSCAWPASETKKLERAFSNRSKPNWLDEDLLHGPVASTASVVEMPKRSFFRGGSLKKRGERGSWPMQELNKQPTLPRVHHTVHGYPSGSNSAAAKAWVQQQEQKKTEIGLGSDKIKGYGCLRLGAGFAGAGRLLPEPPSKAVVAGAQGGIVRRNAVGSMVGSCGQQQPQVQLQQRVAPLPPPHRSLPQTPPRAVARGRSRAQSTDSTLSEILKSTEKRLRAGSMNGGVNRGRHMRMGSLNTRTMSMAGTSQECLLPKKGTGHRRQDSEVSAVSESDSLAGDESPIENPAGLTSPSRSAVQKAGQEQPQQAERKVEMVIQSPRSSMSSSLSTVFSEDEMPEEVKKALMPLDGFVVAPQPATTVQPPVMDDPFITAPVPLPLSINRYSPSTTAVGLRQQQPKTQGLFRESLERSNIQRRMTVGSPAQDLILAPGPSVGPGSTLIQQDDVPRIPAGPLFLRLTKTSTLSTIPILPPPAAPGPVFTQHQQRRKTLSPVKTVSFADELHQVHNVPRHSPAVCPPSPTRPSKKPGIKMSPSQHQLQLSLSRNGNRDSICSTFSVENAPVSVPKKSATAQEINNANFFANSLLYPNPLNLNHLSKSTTSLAISPSPSPSDNPTPDSDAEASASASDSEDEDDIPLANTVASLRRMNSQMSTSSVISLHNENPKRFSGNLQNFQKRKSIGARNYLSLGANVNTAQRRKRSQSVANGSGGAAPAHSRSNSQPPPLPNRRPGSSRVVSGNVVGILNASLSQASLGSPRVSREVIPLAYPVDKRQSGWEWGGNVGPGNMSPPHKKRKPGSVHERRQSLLRMSVLETVADSSLVAATGENNKENGEGFKLPVREEFTFHSGYAGLGGRMSLGNFGTPRRDGNGRGGGHQGRNSVESLGLYDRQGFLITSPVRNGSGGTGSPLRGLMVQQERLQSSPSRLRV